MTNAAVSKKKIKSLPRLTFLLSCNSVGLKQYLLKICFKLQLQCFFNKIFCREPRLNYRYNGTKRMRNSFFNEYLTHNDRCIGRTSDKRALLILDNCFCTWWVDLLPDLIHVLLKFLSSSTTSKVLLPDTQGVFVGNKKYCSRLLYCNFDNVDGGCKPIFKLDHRSRLGQLVQSGNRLPCPYSRIFKFYNYCLKETMDDVNTPSNNNRPKKMHWDAWRSGNHVQSSLHFIVSLGVLRNQRTMGIIRAKTIYGMRCTKVLAIMMRRKIGRLLSFY